MDPRHFPLCQLCWNLRPGEVELQSVVMFAFSRVRGCWPLSVCLVNTRSQPASAASPWKLGRPLLGNATVKGAGLPCPAGMVLGDLWRGLTEAAPSISPLSSPSELVSGKHDGQACPGARKTPKRTGSRSPPSFLPALMLLERLGYSGHFTESCWHTRTL